MTVVFHPKARKALVALGREQPKLARAIVDKLAHADERRNFNELDVKKLEGVNPPAYRLRVGGYRVEFVIGAGELWVTRIDKRGQLYK